MNRIDIYSFNAKGLSEPSKRREVFWWLRTKAPSIVFLQEAHCTKNVEHIWESEWGYKMLFSHGTSASAGVSILFNNNFQCDIKKVHRDVAGRYIIADVLIENIKITLVNLYAPNVDDPAFFSPIFQ